MFVFKAALPVIDVQEPFQHRPYWSNDDLPGFLERLRPWMRVKVEVK